MRLQQTFDLHYSDVGTALPLTPLSPRGSAEYAVLWCNLPVSDPHLQVPRLVLPVDDEHISVPCSDGPVQVQALTPLPMAKGAGQVLRTSWVGDLPDRGRAVIGFYLEANAATALPMLTKVCDDPAPTGAPGTVTLDEESPRVVVVSVVVTGPEQPRWLVHVQDASSVTDAVGLVPQGSSRAVLPGGQQPPEFMAGYRYVGGWEMLADAMPRQVEVPDGAGTASSSWQSWTRLPSRARGSVPIVAKRVVAEGMVRDETVSFEGRGRATTLRARDGSGWSSTVPRRPTSSQIVTGAGRAGRPNRS